MSDLNLKQIEDKLNNEFSKETRTIIFWYDEKQEFINDIENLNLENAKIHHLTPTNLFKTKMMLERRDKKNNFLIYAPFEKPENRENHLADTILYSKEFFADKVSLLAVDLGIDSAYKPILEKHIKFFNAQSRTKRFYELEVDSYNEETIEIALLSAATRSKVANFEEVVRIILAEGLHENKHIEELAKYDLEEVFWRHCKNNFSYIDEEPNLIKFSIHLLLTYAKHQIGKNLPSNLKKYILNKPGTVMAFLDQMMNSSLYQSNFRDISYEVYRNINGEEVFRDYDIENLLNVDVFKDIDEIIIDWVLDRIFDENLNAEVEGLNIPEVCKNRKFKHFRDLYKDEYDVLINAYYLIKNKDFKPKDNIVDLVAEYDSTYYKLDTYYRRFYYHLDRVETKNKFEELETIVENIYTNCYLDVISKEFSNKLDYEKLKDKYKLQKNFYNNFVSGQDGRVVVIISDAFRYEIAKELMERFKLNEKVEAKIEPQIGVLPSYTGLGMAALLPNKNIKMDNDYRVYVDDMPTSNLLERRAILQNRNPKSDCIQYDDLIKMRKGEMREFFLGKEIIYIYHDEIDARAHSVEDKVFDACNETLEAMEDIIRILTNNVSTTRFIITADHGFIYTRGKNVEADKIDRFFAKEDRINKRFIISSQKYDIFGTKNILVSDVLGNYDERVITMPLTSNVFKTQGGGQNFVHGGSSPQEIIVPVIEVRTVRGAVEVEKVKISLISMISKITSLLLSLDFVQQEPVSDIMKEATYKIAFIDDEGELISNEEIYVAKSRSKNSSDRIFNLKFRLRNQRYSRDGKYYFTIRDEETGIEVHRKQVVIDIAFADDFGFDI